MKRVLLFLALMAFSGPTLAGELHNLKLVTRVYEKYVDEFSSLQGLSSVGITTCIAGVPAHLHGPQAPDIHPEACIQMTFEDKASLQKARGRYGRSFRLEGALVYVGDILKVGIQPGISVHN